MSQNNSIGFDCLVSLIDWLGFDTLWWVWCRHRDLWSMCRVDCDLFSFNIRLLLWPKIYGAFLRRDRLLSFIRWCWRLDIGFLCNFRLLSRFGIRFFYLDKLRWCQNRLLRYMLGQPDFLFSFLDCISQINGLLLRFLFDLGICVVFFFKSFFVFVLKSTRWFALILRFNKLTYWMLCVDFGCNDRLLRAYFLKV